MPCICTVTSRKQYPPPAPSGLLLFLFFWLHFASSLLQSASSLPIAVLDWYNRIPLFVLSPLLPSLSSLSLSAGVHASLSLCAATAGAQRSQTATALSPRFVCSCSPLCSPLLHFCLSFFFLFSNFLLSSSPLQSPFSLPPLPLSYLQTTLFISQDVWLSSC